MGMLTDLLFPNGDPFSLERAIYGAPATAPSAAPGAPPAGGGAASPSPSPAGMLAGLFGGSASFPTSGPTGAFPAPASTIPLPMPRPSPTAGDAFASAVPPPSRGIAPPAAPQAPASPLSAMASAAPSGGQGEAPPVPQTSLLGRIGSIFGDRAGSVLGGVGDALDSRRNTLMALGAGLAGAPTLGTGISRGLTGAIPASQLDRQQGFQNATLHFLTSRLGMPPDQAQMVVSNPALMAQLAPQIFGAKQMTATTIGTDVLGHPIPGMMNPFTGEHFDVYGRKLTPGGPAGGPGGGLASIDPAKWAGMAPEERLATMDPQVAGEIKAIYEGRQAATGRNVQQLLPLVNQVYPDFTMQDYKQRQDALHDFYGGGKSQQTVKNLNQFVGHLGMLPTLVDKQGNWGGALTPLNAFANAAKSTFGATGQNPIVTTAHAAADELSAFFKGQGISDTEIKQWKSSFRENGSPSQQREDVDTLMSLADHGIDALEKKRVDGLGPELAAKKRPMIDAKTQATIDAIKAWAAGNKTAAAPAPPAGGAQPAAAPTVQLPPQVASQLKEGVHTKFGNGQTWTLQGDQPMQVQ